MYYLNFFQENERPLAFFACYRFMKYRENKIIGNLHAYSASGLSDSIPEHPFCLKQRQEKTGEKIHGWAGFPFFFYFSL
jgi:hypothetical protein